MQQARFHIEAKLTVDATKEQFREMPRNLLAERFGLKVHPDKKEMSGYELVLAKAVRRSRRPRPTAKETNEHGRKRKQRRNDQRRSADIVD
jgi:uncharacterized protein (TIGR03435 family)